MDEAYWRALLSGEKKGFRYDVFRALLSGLAGLYSGGLSVYLAAERIGLRKRTKLSIPVISVGNLTTGGTGKTPMVQRLARHFQEEGRPTVVLSRGFRGAREHTGAVVSDADGKVLLGADEAGDEAVLLADTLPGVPVIVGKDRKRSAKLAIERFNPQLILLDDGLQYWQLARDLDIVLIDAKVPFDNGYPLPRGLLREPKRNIRRAGVVVVTRSDQIEQDQRALLLHELSELAPGVPVFFTRHTYAGFKARDPKDGHMDPEACLAVCAIGQPGSFLQAAKQAGIPVVASLILEDHSRYGQAEKEKIAGKIRECQALSVVTTEKDAVKMPLDFLDVPIFTLRTEMEIEDERGFWRTVERRAGLVRPGESNRQSEEEE
jgi:tetraacyldisaccharide 4'-kinase